MNHLQKKEIQTLNLTETTLKGTLKNGEGFISYIPSAVDWNVVSQNYVIPQVEEGAISSYSSNEPLKTPWYISMLPTVIMIGVLIVFWFMIMNQGGGGGSSAGADSTDGQPLARRRGSCGAGLSASGG